jgi:hypothetical protein
LKTPTRARVTIGCCGTGVGRDATGDDVGGVLAGDAGAVQGDAASAIDVDDVTVRAEVEVDAAALGACVVGDGVSSCTGEAGGVVSYSGAAGVDSGV